MADTVDKPFPSNVINGRRYPLTVTQEHLGKMKLMKLYPDDVWVTSYPKCGSTWTRWIVKLILNKGQPDDVEIHQACPHVEIADVSQPDFVALFDNRPRPRVFKSHFPYDIFPCGLPHETPCKYIYMTRNPKDVAVSFYCQIKGGHVPDLTWGKYIGAMMRGEVASGDYFDHLLGWWEHRSEKNILFLTYEDRMKDLSGEIKKIADFIDADLSSHEMSKVVELAAFEKMKKDDRVNQSWRKNYVKDGEPMFLRKGVVGDWKNFFTPEQSREMDVHCAENSKAPGWNLSMSELEPDLIKGI